MKISPHSLISTFYFLSNLLFLLYLVFFSFKFFILSFLTGQDIYKKMSKARKLTNGMSNHWFVKVTEIPQVPLQVPPWFPGSPQGAPLVAYQPPSGPLLPKKPPSPHDATNGYKNLIGGPHIPLEKYRSESELSKKVKLETERERKRVTSETL